MTVTAPPILSHINLQGGWPTPRLHPVKDLQTASGVLYSQDDVAQKLMYGPEHGDRLFRTRIGQWLGSIYAPRAGEVAADRILITNGASNGLATILQKFTDPAYTRAVWMVEPTYFLACPVFRDAGLGGKIRGVPEATDGVDLSFLQCALERVDAAAADSQTPQKRPDNGYPKLYRHIIYAMPTFSNPSGLTMSLEHRQDLIRLARRHDALVVSDDVYDMLRWWLADDSTDEAAMPVPACLPRLVDVDREMTGGTVFGNAVSNGSFTKIVAPGVRVGWLEAMPPFIEAMATVGATVSGGCQGHFASLIISEMLANGALTRHINMTLNPTYRHRYRVLVQAIQHHLYPLGVEIVALDQTTARGWAGGFFLYLSFMHCTGAHAADVARVAREQYSVQIAPGSMFSVPDDPESIARSKVTYCNGARLCWAWNEDADLCEGVRRVAKAVEAVRGV